VFLRGRLPGSFPAFAINLTTFAKKVPGVDRGFGGKYFMQLWTQGTSRLGLALLGAASVCAIAGLVSGFIPEAGQGAELSPAEVVALRFPSGWEQPAVAEVEPTPPSAPAAVQTSSPAKLAARPRPTTAQPVELSETRNAVRSSADSIFSPYPTYALASASSDPVRLPEQALGYADPRNDSTVAASSPAAVERRAAPHPKEPNGLFNSAQLASIKERLQLSPDQEQLWPPVEAALRAIGYRYNRGAQGARKGDTRTAVVAPTSEEVQRLKSAATPLIMTMREDQKREVRTLVHLLGLEQLAAQF
jgi:hypothetical protein